MRERRFDLVVAALVFVGAMISAALSAVAGMYGQEQAPVGYAVFYAVALAVPLAFRRRWPGVVLVCVALAYFVGVTVRIPEVYAGNIAVFIAFYTVGAWSADRRRAHLVRIAVTAGMFAWLLTVMFVSATAPTDTGFSRAGAFSPYVAVMLLNLLINVLFFGGAYYFGESSYRARMQRLDLEARTRELHDEQERSAAQAVALDRVHIARELHDVVAHHVSLMGVQAGAARAVFDRNPDAARSALAAVEDAARMALGELRQVLEALRSTEAGDRSIGEEPAIAGVEGIVRLAEEATAAGLATSVQVIGDARPVAALVEVNLYRIAQEALTNARRHAGTGATADLRLRYLDGAVELEVTNTGRAIATVTEGFGLRGIRERAAISGGVAEIAPRATGGFLVRARLPLGAPSVAEATETAGAAADAAGKPRPATLSLATGRVGDE